MFTQHKETRKLLKKRMVSGQTIEITPQDEKLLRTAYDYMQGFSKKIHYESAFNVARNEFDAFEANLTSEAKALKATRTTSTQVNVMKGYRNDERTEVEKEVDDYNLAKKELLDAEEKYHGLVRVDHKISVKDIETLMKHLGIQPQKRVLDHMIYEVDEMVDDVICWDEFQLCYIRNVEDVTGDEPCTFFRLMEFILFDPNRKGIIQEDDVMEILFARIGAARLEEELQSIYGDNLRARGGTGTITLAQYFAACLAKTGRRSLLFN